MVSTSTVGSIPLHSVRHAYVCVWGGAVKGLAGYHCQRELRGLKEDLQSLDVLVVAAVAWEEQHVFVGKLLCEDTWKTKVLTPCAPYTIPYILFIVAAVTTQEECIMPFPSLPVTLGLPYSLSRFVHVNAATGVFLLPSFPLPRVTHARVLSRTQITVPIWSSQDTRSILHRVKERKLSMKRMWALLSGMPVWPL